ncbi:MAG: NifB/NifX family molybdenum-iron cluster-binding protein [Syntrophaceae bacterium]
MMRIAIAKDGDYVAAHLGRCSAFTLVDIDGNKVTTDEVIDNPGHQAGFIPRILHDRGVRCIMTGSMGTRAVELFRELDIEAITGVNGKVTNTIDKIIRELEALRINIVTLDTGGG